jgi:tetratricopeptide (TPR) repeat protein
VRLDPNFALAWARLASIRSFLYFNRIESNTNTAAAVKQAADRAMALAPQAGESWIAQGAYRYRVLRDFSGALAAYEEAQKRLPNNALVYEYMAYVQRRLGRWQDAEANYKKALELDPRDIQLLSSMGNEFYNYLRRFDDALAMLDRALEISPDSEQSRANKANVLLAAGRLHEAAEELARIPANSTEDWVVAVRVVQALYERNYDAAIQIAERRMNATTAGQPLDSFAISALANAGYCYAWTGRSEEARRAFARVINELQPTPDTVVPADANGSPILPAQAYAGLGQKENALKQAQQALKEYETDAIGKAQTETAVAQIQAQLGDHDAAIAALQHLLEVPAGVTTADLKFNPFWDPLRKDPRFQKLSEEK